MRAHEVLQSGNVVKAQISHELNTGRIMAAGITGWSANNWGPPPKLVGSLK